MKRFFVRAGTVAGCFFLVIVLASCGSASSVGDAGITPISSPALVSLSQAQRKLAFHFAAPQVTPSGAVLAGVQVITVPGGIDASPSAHGAGGNWATAQYKWAKGQEGPWFYVFSLNETTLPTHPPPAIAATRSSAGTTFTLPQGIGGPRVIVTPSADLPEVQSQTTVTINNVRVVRSVLAFNDLGKSGNQKGITTDYHWRSHGISFDLTRYGNQFSDSTAEKIIDSMIK